LQPADAIAPSRQEFHLTAEEPTDAATLLAAATGLTKTRVKQIMQQGAVWWQKGDQIRRLRRARRELATGDQLHLYLDPRVLAMAVPPAVLIADEG